MRSMIAGIGRKIDYLARYLFRVAISNSRLRSFPHGQVTFGYRTTAPKKPLGRAAYRSIPPHKSCSSASSGLVSTDWQAPLAKSLIAKLTVRVRGCELLLQSR